VVVPSLDLAERLTQLHGPLHRRFVERTLGLDNGEGPRPVPAAGPDEPVELVYGHTEVVLDEWPGLLVRVEDAGPGRGGHDGRPVDAANPLGIVRQGVRNVAG